MTRLAVIGMGARASSILELMRQLDADVQLAAVADPDEVGVWQRLRRLGISQGETKIYPSAEYMLEHADHYDGVIIGTPCNLHTPTAIMVAETRLPLLLEKPVAITHEQLVSLRDAFRGQEDSVVVSFPLRYTPLFAQALEMVRSGRLGTINQVQAINNVPYGGVYFGQWYRNFDQSGGLWLQKATHDFDYINLLVGSRPIQIAATVTQRIYGGDMPHDLRCSACDLVETCMESPRNIALRGDDGGMYMGSSDKSDHWCAFSKGIKNQDAGSALILYEDSSHASYSQNFVTRRSAYRRGAVVTGYLATLEFDWASESIRVVEHHSDRVDRFEVPANLHHSGGDHVLVKNFLDVVRSLEKSMASLHDGLLSAAMCLSARESSRGHTFQPVPSLN
jgi:predicted dehydrogenase